MQWLLFIAKLAFIPTVHSLCSHLLGGLAGVAQERHLVPLQLARRHAKALQPPHLRHRHLRQHAPAHFSTGASTVCISVCRMQVLRAMTAMRRQVKEEPWVM